MTHAQPAPSTAVPTSASSATERPIIELGAGEGQAVWFLDNLLTVKVAGESGAPFSVVENAMPVGSHTPFHQHDDEDEAFYVLEGTLRVHFDGGRVVEAGAGSYLHIPRGTPHGFLTLSAVRMLVLCGTAGFVEMARDYGSAAPEPVLPPPSAPDLPRLQAACDRHGIRILGPLPE